MKSAMLVFGETPETKAPLGGSLLDMHHQMDLLKAEVSVEVMFPEIFSDIGVLYISVIISPYEA